MGEISGRAALAASVERLSLNAGVHNLADSRADDVHFGSGEPVTAREVARGAGRADVALYVRQGVVDTVKPARAFCGSAVYTRLDNHGQDFGAGHVAGINPLVSLAQKYGPALVGFRVAPLPRHDFFPLLWRVFGPTVRSIIAPALSIAVAGPAFIGQPKRAGRITQEDVRRRLQKLLASVAITEAFFGRNQTLSHEGFIA